ncbi:hypothetical protein RQ479_00480 [Mesorhizobium sp. ISC25]|uniref:hypothetical protein n=1 Tax=Mesorhizobium sp. ISC25 TaxID=3077335 RepID=UPI0035DDAE38
MSDEAKKHAAESASRLFRAYERHCFQPDLDTLFATLTAIHSLNDRLKKAVGYDFHKFEEFLALKALRNLTHHAEEVRANVRVVPAPGFSDLMLCIVRRDQVERAIAGVDERWRAGTKAACERTFHWYGPAVNINPCIFNFMVHAYEMLEDAEMTSADEATETFRAAYQFEADNGHSHFVDGRISGRAGDIESILSAVAAELPKP